MAPRIPGWNCRSGIATQLSGMMSLTSWAAAALLLATVSANAAPGNEPDPASYVWKSRVLLAFAPTEGDPALAEQVRIVADAQAGMAERDLVLLRDVGGGKALRDRYGVGGTEFAVLLIGKDGGVKLRSDRPIPAGDLFRTVDAMPMRRGELGRSR